MKEFVLPFFGLKLGTHTFNFDVDQSFFASFENTLIEEGRFNVTLSLEKLTNMLVLSFKAKGTVNDLCDRCGDAITLKVKASDEIVVKFGDEDFEQVDEIVIVSHDTHEIDVAQYIYEMIVLNLPRKKTHKHLKDCNQEVIERLRIEQNDKEDDDDTDPRWEALKRLK